MSRPDATTRPIPPWEGGPVVGPPERRSWWSRHTVLTAVLVVAGALLVSCTVGGIVASNSVRAVPGETPLDEAEVPAPAAPAAAPADDAVSGIGDPVRDGRFEFVVTAVREPVPSIAPEPWTHRAQGQFVLVDVTVRNIGDEPQVFTDSAQKAYAGEARFDADGHAGRLLEDNAVDWETVNPGNELRGTLVFDTPPGAVLTELALHDSWFSGGVRVRLG